MRVESPLDPKPHYLAHRQVCGMASNECIFQVYCVDKEQIEESCSYKHEDLRESPSLSSVCPEPTKLCCWDCRKDNCHFYVIVASNTLFSQFLLVTVVSPQEAYPCKV